MTIEDQSRADIAKMRALLERYDQEPGYSDLRNAYAAELADALPTLLIELEATRAAAERIAELEGEVARLAERGAQAVIAYNVAIACPKGVVPVDEFYDPVIAGKASRDMDYARAALQRKEPGALQGRER